MEKLYQEMKGEDFEILAVSIDVLGATAVKPFMTELNLTFPALLDPQGAIKNLYNTTGVPETFIIDKNGFVAAKIIGARNWASPDAVKAFKDMLKKPGDETKSNHGSESGKTK